MNNVAVGAEAALSLALPKAPGLGPGAADLLKLGFGAEAEGAGIIRQDILVCLPERLHPISQIFLDHWLAGEMTTAEFLRWFHIGLSDGRDCAN